MNQTICFDYKRLHPLYNELLVCIVSVFILAILILCKLLRKQLFSLYNSTRSVGSRTPESTNSEILTSARIEIIDI